MIAFIRAAFRWLYGACLYGGVFFAYVYVAGSVLVGAHPHYMWALLGIAGVVDYFVRDRHRIFAFYEEEVEEDWFPVLYAAGMRKERSTFIIWSLINVLVLLCTSYVLKQFAHVPHLWIAGGALALFSMWTVKVVLSKGVLRIVFSGTYNPEWICIPKYGNNDTLLNLFFQKGDHIYAFILKKQQNFWAVLGSYDRRHDDFIGINLNKAVIEPRDGRWFIVTDKNAYRLY